MTLSLDALTTGGLVLVAVAAAWYDVRERRVPNPLTAGGLLVGLGLGALQGPAGLGLALAGAGLAFLVALPVFMAGGLGGGDVKLLAAVGAFLGPAQLPAALLAIALVGGAMAAVEVVRRRAVARTVMNLWILVKSAGRGTLSRWKSRETGGALTVDDAAAITLPYALAIAVGAVLVRLLLP